MKTYKFQCTVWVQGESAEEARKEAIRAATLTNKASYNGEANGWLGAAYILRRTTLKENAQ